ncbi:MAG TPA: hypothetical protein VFT36_03140 [Methylomirabilota bacterium]|nr:hypothetical protein [Methylomirabilota bacterium]
MPLFAVERDLSQVPPDRFRSDLRDLVKACERLRAAGKRVRYISSAVFPSEARGLCLFGAEEPQLIRDVNEAARLPYLRIFAVLDLTPAGVRRELSVGRRSPQPVTATAAVRGASGHREIVNGRTAPNGGSAAAPLGDVLAHWSDEGRQLLDALGGWLEEAAQVQGQAECLQGERDRLVDHVCRLREENDALRAERDELEQALQTLAGRMTHAADAILGHLRRRESRDVPTGP